jgi:regulator of protease activity HflC (stomatin/prohibitin superfamily)
MSHIQQQKTKSNMKKSVIISVILLIIALVGSIVTIKIGTVEGNEIGVLETWSKGVVEEPLPPKTYIWIPGFNKRLFTYEISQQVYVMNDQDSGDEFGEGRRSDSYRVQSEEGQDMDISLAVQWRRDPLKIVELHKTVKDNVEERILRPEVQRIVKDEATTRTALEAYSGAGLVELQQAIQNRLQDTEGELYKRGILIDNFVIQHIGLDPSYVGEIKQKQVAVQERLKAIEQTKAAEANAEKAKAEAQADYEREIVGANRDKDKGILEAEKEAEQRILDATAKAKEVELAAEAQKNQNILVAEGEKEAGLLRAEAIIAIGEAEAQATKMKLQAYNTEGADAFVKIEVSKNMTGAFENIKGYLPSDMNVTLLSQQYTDGVNLLVSPATGQ